MVESVNRALDLMKSFPVCQAVPRAEMTDKVLPTRWSFRKKESKQVRTRFVVRQFAKLFGYSFYNTTPGLEVTSVLLTMILSKDFIILFGDINVAFINTSMPDDDPVYVELPESLY